MLITRQLSLLIESSEIMSFRFGEHHEIIRRNDTHRKLNWTRFADFTITVLVQACSRLVIAELQRFFMDVSVATSLCDDSQVEEEQ